MRQDDDVLDAKVCLIYQGIYGLQAGYCSDENYEKWVRSRRKLRFRRLK